MLHGEEFEHRVDLGMLRDRVLDVEAQLGVGRLADQQVLGVSAERIGDPGQHHPDNDRRSAVVLGGTGDLVQALPVTCQHDPDHGRAVLAGDRLHGRVVAASQMPL